MEAQSSPGHVVWDGAGRGVRGVGVGGDGGGGGGGVNFHFRQQKVIYSAGSWEPSLYLKNWPK